MSDGKFCFQTVYDNDITNAPPIPMRDAQSVLAKRAITNHKRLQRFDSGDFFSAQAKRDTTVMIPTLQNEVTDTAKTMVANRAVANHQRLQRFDSADFFGETGVAQAGHGRPKLFLSPEEKRTHRKTLSSERFHGWNYDTNNIPQRGPSLSSSGGSYGSLGGLVDDENRTHLNGSSLVASRAIQQSRQRFDSADFYGSAVSHRGIHALENMGRPKFSVSPSNVTPETSTMQSSLSTSPLMNHQGNPQFEQFSCPPPPGPGSTNIHPGHFLPRPKMSKFTRRSQTPPPIPTNNTLYTFSLLIINFQFLFF